MGENLKPAKCVQCGADIMITKFGSLKTCKCDNCKEKVVVEKSNKEKPMKDAKCVACGKDIQIWKFGSVKTCKCDECKENNKEIDPEILASIAKEKSKDNPSPVGNMKPAKCIICDKDIMVTKFASLKTCKCDDCKGVKSPKPSDFDYDGEDFVEKISIDKSKIDTSKLANLDEYFVLSAVLKNKRLRKVNCPACGCGEYDDKHMKIIKIMDGSIRGVVVTYQCYECHTVVSISEQTQHKLTPCTDHSLFNYRGDSIRDLIPKMRDTVYANIINHLLDLLQNSGIAIDGVDIPTYLTKKDLPKVEVPKGFSTDDEILKEEGIGKINTVKVCIDDDIDNPSQELRIGKSYYRVHNFIGCPEDAMIGRDLITCTDLVSMLETGYEMGKSGEVLKVEYESPNEDE